MKPLLLTVALLGALVAAAAEPVPLTGVHAHNDYLHARPLFDALDQGFCSVEADIFLVDGKLLVAHTRSAVKPERTLEALYLDPLRERVRRNGGRVYPNGPECTLLIDIKTDWHTLYPVLRATLTNYADLLSTFRDGAKRTNAITAILSGNRSKEMFAGETVRFAGYDGTLADLDSSAPADLIPWISGNWADSFDWRGKGELPEADAARLKSIVAKAHARSRRVRFWGAPDNAGFWRAMRDAHVDLINTDDLPGLADFFRHN
jgi:hypothetical protein